MDLLISLRSAATDTSASNFSGLRTAENISPSDIERLTASDTSNEFSPTPNNTSLNDFCLTDVSFSNLSFDTTRANVGSISSLPLTSLDIFTFFIPSLCRPFSNSSINASAINLFLLAVPSALDFCSSSSISVFALALLMSYFLRQATRSFFTTSVSGILDGGGMSSPFFILTKSSASFFRLLSITSISSAASSKLSNVSLLTSPFSTSSSFAFFVPRANLYAAVTPSNTPPKIKPSPALRKRF